MRNHRIPWRRNRKYRRFFDHGIELDPINSPLVLEDTIESVKSVRPKESSPNSISRNHSIEPMVPPLIPPHPSSKFRADRGGKRWKLFEIKIDLVTTDPRTDPRSRGVMRGGCVPAAGHLPSFPATLRKERKGKERERARKNKTNFTKSTVSMDQLSKFFHHPPPVGSCTNRFLPHQPPPHHPSTRPDHTSLFTLFPPVPGISRIPWVVRS